MRKQIALAASIALVGAASADEVFSIEFDGSYDVPLEWVALGNGLDDGGTPEPDDDVSRGAYVEGADGDVYVQHFFDATNANLDAGAAAFKLDGITLIGGTEYNLRMMVSQFRQDWDQGLNFYAGFSDTEPTDPNTIPMFETFFTVPDNNNFVYGPVNEYVLTFTPTSDMVDPWVMIRTDRDELLTFGYQARVGLASFSIDDGPTGGVLPGCNLADVAEPYDILDLSDISAFIESFTAGCD